MNGKHAFNSGRHSARNAFTLLEIVVSIGIIASLGVIAIPSIVQVQKVARSSACRSNQARIIRALMHYHADNNAVPMNFGKGYKANPSSGFDYNYMGGLYGLETERWALGGLNPYIFG